PARPASGGQAAPPAAGARRGAAAGGGGSRRRRLGAGLDRGRARAGFALAHGRDLPAVGRAVRKIPRAPLTLRGGRGRGGGVSHGAGGPATGESRDAAAGAQCARERNSGQELITVLLC